MGDFLESTSRHNKKKKNEGLKSKFEKKFLSKKKTDGKLQNTAGNTIFLSSGTDPHLARQLILSSYSLFSIIFHGGVLYRILKGTNTKTFLNETYGNKTPQPLPQELVELQNLFKHERKARKYLEQVEFNLKYEMDDDKKLEDEHTRKNLVYEISQYQQEINTIKSHYKLNPIRNDLSNWFNEFISNFNDGKRNVQEYLPFPSTFQRTSPFAENSFLHFEEMIDDFLASFDSSVLAISVFFESTLLYNQGVDALMLSNKHVSLVFGHFMKHHTSLNKIPKQKQKQQQTSSLNLLVRTLSFKSSSKDYGALNENIQERDLYSASYLRPSSHEALDILGNAWVPKINLYPCKPMNSNDEKNDHHLPDTVGITVLEFAKLNLHFMIYFRKHINKHELDSLNCIHPNTKEEVKENDQVNNNAEEYLTFEELENIRRFLSTSVERIMLHNANHNANTKKRNTQKTSTHLASVQEGLKAIYIDEKQHITRITTPSSLNYDSIKHYLSTLFMDCVILAIEDVLFEINLQKSKAKQTCHEMCTFLPCQKWVFGLWKHNKILLLVCDAHHFVTLTDVQKAVTCVKKEMIIETM